MASPAYQEATRPIGQHLVLQRDLVQLGFLQDSGGPAGVYGVATRAAISNWQRSRGRAVTGFLDDEDAAVLKQQAGGTPAVATVQQGRAAAASDLADVSGGAETGARDEIALTSRGGDYLVPVRINSAITLDFILDSGAEDVSIPADVALTLVRAHTIDERDIVGKQTFVLADGSKREDLQFRLRELQIGNVVLKNVLASVTPEKGQLLLGQSFLSRFASWTLDNKRHVLVLSIRD